MCQEFTRYFIILCLLSLLLFGAVCLLQPKYFIYLFIFIILFICFLLYKIEKYSENCKKSTEEQSNFIIRETSHRIKNNITILANIIDLKRYVYSDPETQNLLSDLRNKTILISSIHEEIYKSYNTKLINIKSYVENVVNITNNFYGNDVKINFDIDDININSKHAINIVLIIQEFFTNAIKYAFDCINDKVFNIEFTCIDQTHYLLIISDNGKGFDTFDLNNGDSFGYKMITTIIEQYNGKIELKNNSGATARISLDID